MVADQPAELRALAEHLAPELALEVYRLQDVDARHAQVVAELAETRRRLHSSTVMVGEMRQRALRAEVRLADLGADEIRKARAAAHLLGDGFVHITSLGRGRFVTTHVPTRQVVLHAD